MRADVRKPAVVEEEEEGEERVNFIAGSVSV